jgi:hypothetical protein
MTNSNNTNSNIFVQQTFDGEKMVSASVINRRVVPINTNDTSSNTATVTPTATTASPTATTLATTATTTAATKTTSTAATKTTATASTNAAPVLNTPPANTNNKSNNDSNAESSNQNYKFVSAKVTSLLKSANKEPIASRLANHLQQQRASHTAAQNKPNKNENVTVLTSPTPQHPTPPLPPPKQQQPPPPPAPSVSNHTTPVPQSQYYRTTYSNLEDYKRYWSEANVAVLIQLHRKHYHGIISEDPSTSSAAWKNLTVEYNGITNDDRSLTELMCKWDKLLAKYNAERSCLMLQRRVSSGLQQPMPLVSYWNHFQYMDGYLAHLPVPDQCLYKRKRKRSQSELPISQLLDTQRLYMEQTALKQQQQIDMMVQSYDAMNKMNTKFVELCEKVTSGTRVNEDRYLNLLEKLIKKEDGHKDQNNARLTVEKLREIVPAVEAVTATAAEEEKEEEEEEEEEEERVAPIKSDSCILF